MGRPSEYTEETAERICERLALGESLLAICRDDAMPGERTVYMWLADSERYPQFVQRYAQARERQADTLAAQALEIADTCEDPAKARLQVDTRKWMAGKLRPKVYGDRISQEVSGPGGGPIEVAAGSKVVDPRLIRIAYEELVRKESEALERGVIDTPALDQDACASILEAEYTEVP